jgi:mono/diheme cytochrome c family protein
MKGFLVILTAIFLTGCFDSDDVNAQATDSAELGETTFNQNCTSCHGKEGQGLVKDWKKTQANGKYPAPPINGTAHAWHHSPKALLTTINNGGIKIGGWMPGFKDKLSEGEKQGLLDYIHGLWPNEIQQKYNTRFK